MTDLIKKQDVMDILLDEYKRWRNWECPSDDTEFIAIGAVGAISNVVCKIMFLEYENLCEPHQLFPCRVCGTKHFDGCECGFCRELK